MGNNVEKLELKKMSKLCTPSAVTKICFKDFPGGAAVKHPPANAGNTGSSAGLGRSHMPRSN